MAILSHFSPDMNSCNVVTTDRATNMTGTFSTLQAKIREIEQCLVHSLKLVAEKVMENETTSTHTDFQKPTPLPAMLSLPIHK